MSSLIETGAEFDIKETGDTQTSAPTPKLHVKPTIPKEEIPEEMRGRALTKEELTQLADLVSAKFNGNKSVQIMSKAAAPITDFSKLTQNDIYDPGINIEAKPYMSGDPLKVVLKDTNYEARWVNKKSERLGYMKAIGFTYVESADLAQTLEVDITTDANGQFSFHDVVLMKVPKAQYYPALRAAHQKAQAAVDPRGAARRGVNEANKYMGSAKDDISGIGGEATGEAIGGDYAEAARSRQMEFYQPGA